MGPIEHLTSGAQCAGQPTLEAGRSTLDQKDLGRLKWRARRGLLENDLVMARFFARFGGEMTPQDAQGLEALLELSDNELMDLILARTELDVAAGSADSRRILSQLRSV
jgi:antitoxin CptB